MNISIIGSGHVGLVTGACLADLGHNVLCVDNDPEKISILKTGKPHFYEPGLPELVRYNFLEGRLAFTESIAEGTKHGSVIFIAVGTPPKETGEADLSAVERVCREIAENLDDYKVVVEKSTVPVKTGELVQQFLNKHIRSDAKFDVASVPEFLREGTAIKDFKYPDRIVIGATSSKAAGILTSIFEPLNAPLLLTDIHSAELVKHCANAFLAMKISFINAVAHVCELSGADVKKVAMGIGLDKRIGLEFLKPGVGYGGSCFPKDLSGFRAISEQLGYKFKLLEEVENINDFTRNKAIKKLRDLLGNKLENKKITVLGLAFKPGTDDIRSSPAIEIIQELLKLNSKVTAYDPVAMHHAEKFLKNVTFAKDVYSACQGADAVLVATEWPQFRQIDLNRLKGIMNQPIIVDGRNIFEPFRMKEIGFQYNGYGRSL